MATSFGFGRTFAATLALTAALGAAPVMAADAITEMPPTPMPVEEMPVATWAGGYVGLQAGYGFSGRTKAPGVGVNTDGFVGGAFGGWNGQSGMIVYGVEADVGYDGHEGGNSVIATHNGVDGSLRARIGVAATDNVLIYGTAGGAAKSMKVLDATASDRQTMLGWTAGVGADVKVTDQTFVRGEYRYTDYGSENFALSGGPTSVDSRENKFLLGLGVKF